MSRERVGRFIANAALVVGIGGFAAFFVDNVGTAIMADAAYPRTLRLSDSLSVKNSYGEKVIAALQAGENNEASRLAQDPPLLQAQETIESFAEKQRYLNGLRGNRLEAEVFTGFSGILAYLIAGLVNLRRRAVAAASR